MEWLQKDKSHNISEFDGEVIIQFEMHVGKTRIQFKFRKNSIHKIATDCEYIVIAKDGDRIYFKESNVKYGFKVSNYGQNTKVFKVKYDRFHIDEDKLGEYNLEFDTNLGLHYISLNRKLEKTLNWEGK